MCADTHRPVCFDDVAVQPCAIVRLRQQHASPRSGRNVRALFPCAPRANTSPQQRLRLPQVMGLDELTERVRGRIYVTMCHGEDSVSACLCVARCCLRLLPCFSPALVVVAVFRVGGRRLSEVPRLTAGVFPARGKVPDAPGQSRQPQSACLYYASARASNGSQDAAIENHSAQVCTSH